MAKSDLENALASSSSAYNSWNTTRELLATDDALLDKSDSTVLSGHFMVSSLQDDDGEGDEIDEGSPSNKNHDVDPAEASPKGYDFTMATRDTSKTYKFGSRSTNQLAIDQSLTKLFECMTLAYSGKLTSPKWKNFKGIKVPLKDKIRLNNIIWREWHMQYIQAKNPIICQFEPPISERMHSKPEAVVLEGKYWKRRLESVTAEYKKWRMFFRDKFMKESRDDSFMDMAMSIDRMANMENRKLNNVSRNGTSPQITQSIDSLMSDEDFIMDLSDTLFSSLNQPFMFPNPREISQLGNADIIQPGLVQLQPSLDDFMDTLDPLPLPSLNEMLGANMKGVTPSPAASVSSLLSDPLSAPIPMPMDTQLGGFSTPGLSSILENEGLIPRNGSDRMHHHSAPSQMHQSKSQVNLSAQGLAPNNNASIDPAALSALLNNSSVIQPTPTPTDNDKKMVGNVSTPQIINVVLNSGVGTTNFTDNITAQPANIVQPPQFPVQVSSPPTVQQLLNLQQQQQQQQRQQQQQQTTQSNKTVTIIQNTSLQALLQGLTQPSQNGPQIFSSPGGTSVLVSQSQLSTPSVQSNIATVSQIQGVQLKTEPVTFDLGGPSTFVTSPFPIQPANLAIKPEKPPTLNSSSNSDTVLPLLSRETMTKTIASASERRKSTGSLCGSAQVKKDGAFVVPSVTHVPKIRQRPIASVGPSSVGQSAASPRTSQSTQNTVLAQLLGKASPAAAAPCKSESSCPSPLSAFTPIKPAPTVSTRATTSISSSMTFGGLGAAFSSGNSVNDFQKNLLIAAASQAIGTTNFQFSPEVAKANLSQTYTSTSNPNSPRLGTNSPQFLCGIDPASPESDLKIESRSRHPSNESTGSAPGVKDENPSKPFRPKNEAERAQYKELRRASHISAEQKRRGNIKVGFETLHQLVPSLRMTSSSKSSIANTLGKAAEYCKKLKHERTQMHDEAEILKKEIESLNNAISVCQSQLPATGVPVTRQRADQMREMFDNYVRNRTRQNWKFWIFSIIIRSLLDSYNKTVSTASVDELCRTVLAWLEQYCSLVALRPTVLNSLRQLCTTTSILSDPSKVPEQAQQAVQNPGDLSEVLGSPNYASSPS